MWRTRHLEHKDQHLSASDTLFCFSSQAIKDLHLLVIVAGLLAVDVVFLFCWIALDPLQAELLTFKEMVSPLRPWFTPAKQLFTSFA